MAASMRLSTFKRKFASYGVSIERGTKHWKMYKKIDGAKIVYIFAVQKGGKEVLDVYVKKARRRFKLRPEDGVSNREFRSR